MVANVPFERAKVNKAAICDCGLDRSVIGRIRLHGVDEKVRPIGHGKVGKGERGLPVDATDGGVAADRVGAVALLEYTTTKHGIFSTFIPVCRFCLAGCWCCNERRDSLVHMTIIKNGLDAKKAKS